MVEELWIAEFGLRIFDLRNVDWADNESQTSFGYSV